MATSHSTGSRDTDFHSIEECERWLNMDDTEREAHPQYREARARVTDLARYRLERLLGYDLTLIEQYYVSTITREVIPWAIHQRVHFPDVKNLLHINPVQETVARYMRDVLRISLKELRDVQDEFGADRVQRSLFRHHEAIHHI